MNADDANSKSPTADSFAAQLTAYADGALTEDERKKIAAALARDPALQQELDEITRLQNTLRAVLPQRQTPERLTPQRGDFILQQAANVKNSSAKKRLRFSLLWSSLAAGIAAGFIASLTIYYPLSSDYSPTAEADVATLSADPVTEQALAKNEAANQLEIGDKKHDENRDDKRHEITAQAFHGAPASAVSESTTQELIAKATTEAEQSLGQSARGFSAEHAPEAKLARKASATAAPSPMAASAAVAEIADAAVATESTAAVAFGAASEPNASAIVEIPDNGSARGQFSAARSQHQFSIIIEGNQSSFIAVQSQRTSAVNLVGLPTTTAETINPQHFINAMASAWNMDEATDFVFNAAPIPPAYAEILAPSTHIIALVSKRVPLAVSVVSAQQLMLKPIINSAASVLTDDISTQGTTTHALDKDVAQHAARGVFLCAVSIPAASQSASDVISVRVADRLHPVIISQQPQDNITLALSAWLAARHLRGEPVAVERATIMQVLERIHAPQAQMVRDMLLPPTP
jgi:hypothetical protein